jgi:glycerophosphoryl diester phosphodiesterase
MTLLAVAHRAGNSMSRLHSAVALGADVIEADVHSYRGRLEVRHLKTLGPLPWLWDRWELHPASAPRSGLHLKGRRAGIGNRVARSLHAYAPERPVLVCSRYWPALRPFDRLPWVRTVLSARNRSELVLLSRRLRSEPRTYGVSVHRSLLTPAVAAALHERVQLVMTWPVNDLAALGDVSAFAASGRIAVISDADDVLREVLRHRASPRPRHLGTDVEDGGMAPSPAVSAD